MADIATRHEQIAPPGSSHRVKRSRKWGIPLQVGERFVLHRGRWLWLRAGGWLALVLLLTAASFGIPLQVAVDRLPAGNTARGLAAVAVACVAALSCYAVAVRVGEGRGPSEIGLRPALTGLVIGAVTGSLMMAFLMTIMVVAGSYDLTLNDTASPPWTALGVALQAAVTEELWMRALVFRLLWRVLGPVPAFAVSAAVFSALHLTNPGANPLAGATVAVAGLMFCALYALTGRLWVPIGVHLAWNFAQGYLFGAAVSGNDLGGSVAHSTANPAAAAWLTGGAFGPEASLFALILIGATTAVVLVLAGRQSQRRQAAAFS